MRRERSVEKYCTMRTKVHQLRTPHPSVLQRQDGALRKVETCCKPFGWQFVQTLRAIRLHLGCHQKGDFYMFDGLIRAYIKTTFWSFVCTLASLDELQQGLLSRVVKR